MLFVATLALLGHACIALAAEEPLPHQGTPPPGANDFACKPPARHPYPIVIVHGTLGNMSVLWDTVAPAAERLHYCVFALDYGNNATGDIPTSARQLQTFINHVLAATGAKKVTIVGHSQGGMMPRYYIKFLGGASKVDDLVGFSPSNHGTTNPAAPPGGLLGCPACAQQVAGSSFMQHLNAGDQTPPPVDYTVIETKYDEVVTPYQSEFLPKTADGRVTNVLLQDRCPDDMVEHNFFPEDKVAVQLMLNAFGRPGPADPKYRPDCSGAALATFPDSSSVAGSAKARRARLRLGRVRSLDAHRLRFVVRGNGVRVHGVAITIRSTGRSGRLMGRSRRFSLRRRRNVTVHLRNALAAGRYRVTAAGRDAGRRKIVTHRVYRVG